MTVVDFPGQDRVALRIALAGLHEVASWHEGPAVDSTFDEPGSAQSARNIIELIEVRFPWTKTLRPSCFPRKAGDPLPNYGLGDPV